MANLFLVLSFFLRHKLSLIMLLLLCFVTLLIFNLLRVHFSLGLHNGLMNEFFRNSIALLSAIFAICLLRNSTPADQEKIIVLYHKIFIFIAAIDMLIRVAGILNTLNFSSRYVLKSGEIFYYDTNFTACILGFFIVNFLVNDLRISKKWRYTAYVTFLSTASFAAFAAIVIALAGRVFYKRSLGRTIIYTAGIIMLIFYIDIYISSETLNVRFTMIYFLLNFLISDDLNLWLGYGSGNFVAFTEFSRSAHTMLGFVYENGLFTIYIIYIFNHLFMPIYCF